MTWFVLPLWLMRKSDLDSYSFDWKRSMIIISRMTFSTKNLQENLIHSQRIIRCKKVKNVHVKWKMRCKKRAFNMGHLTFGPSKSKFVYLCLYLNIKYLVKLTFDFGTWTRQWSLFGIGITSLGFFLFHVYLINSFEQIRINLFEKFNIDSSLKLLLKNNVMLNDNQESFVQMVHVDQ